MTMHTEDELKDELKDVSFGVHSKPASEAPEGYFELLPDRVLRRWADEKGSLSTNSISLRRIIGTAAVISGLCFGVTWWTNQSNQLQHDTAISTEEAYQYILDHIDEFAPMMLENGQLSEKYIVNIPASATTEEYLLEEMEDDDFESIF